MLALQNVAAFFGFASDNKKDNFILERHPKEIETIYVEHKLYVRNGQFLFLRPLTQNPISLYAPEQIVKTRIAELLDHAKQCISGFLRFEDWGDIPANIMCFLKEQLHLRKISFVFVDYSENMHQSPSEKLVHEITWHNVLFQFEFCMFYMYITAGLDRSRSVTYKTNIITIDHPQIEVKADTIVISDKKNKNYVQLYPDEIISEVKLIQLISESSGKWHDFLFWHRLHDPRLLCLIAAFAFDKN